MVLPLLLLGVLAIPGGCSRSHSLRYFYTGVSESGAGVPSFIAVGYVDDVPFIHYDSETQTARPQPQAPWMEGKIGPHYWETETWNLRKVQAVYKVSLQTLIQRYNKSGGLHTYQNTYGCHLLADGSTWGIDQFAFDGNDFISFDKKTLTWVAADPGAQVTKQKWGDMDIQYRKQYQEQTCVEWLGKYLEYGKEMLQRRERPAVRVTGRDAPGGPTTLCCRAHGFYPRDIALSWLRHGGSSENETWRGGVLPNGDGTYHAWATVEIDPRERGLYRCRVEHESLAKPLDTAWEPPSRSALLPALIGAVAVAALLAGAAGFVLWRRRRSGKTGAGYTPAQEGNRDSSSSPEASHKESSKGSSRGSDSGCDTGSLGLAATSVGVTSFHPEDQQLLAVGVPAPPDDGDPPAGMV